MSLFDDRIVGPDDGRQEEPRGWSPLAVAFIATLVLLLGLGGAIFGINAANRPSSEGPGQTPLPQGVGRTTPGPTPTPTRTPSPTPTATQSTLDDAFPLPNLAGRDFTAARATVRGLKLGWRLEFEGAVNDSTVRTSDPAAGTEVRPGTTIKIFVRGAAPKAVIPNVKGQACAEAAGLIVDSGLYPRYPTGRTGVVLSQTSTTSTLRWNDEMEINCG